MSIPPLFENNEKDIWEFSRKASSDILTFLDERMKPQFNESNDSSSRSINDQIVIAKIQSHILKLAHKAQEKKLQSLEEQRRDSMTNFPNIPAVPSLPLELVSRIVSFVPRKAHVGGQIQEWGSSVNGQVTNWLPHVVDPSRRLIVELHKETYSGLLESIVSHDRIDFRVDINGFWHPCKLNILLSEPSRWKEITMNCRSMIEVKLVFTACQLVLPHIRTFSAQVSEVVNYPLDYELIEILSDVRSADQVKLEDATIPSTFLYAFIDVGLLRSVTCLELVLKDKDDWKDNLMLSIPRLSELAHLHTLCITDRTEQSLTGRQDLHARSQSLRVLQLRVESSQASLGVPAYLNIFRSCAIRSLELPLELNEKSRMLITISLTRHFSQLLEIHFVCKPDPSNLGNGY